MRNNFNRSATLSGTLADFQESVPIMLCYISSVHGQYTTILIGLRHFLEVSQTFRNLVPIDFFLYLISFKSCAFDAYVETQLR